MTLSPKPSQADVHNSLTETDFLSENFDTTRLKTWDDFKAYIRARTARLESICNKRSVPLAPLKKCACQTTSSVSDDLRKQE